MNYILPKSINFSNFEIIEGESIFKIKQTYHYQYDIVIFGIIINVKSMSIEKNYNEYIITIDDPNTKENILNCESYLNKNIPNYSSLLKYNDKNTYLKITRNKIIDNIFNQTINNFFLHIKYVKKSGFLNIPVINIISNER